MPIKVENLSYTYDPKAPFKKDALKNVSLTIEDGDFFGIIGRTGSGKSTLVTHFNGLIEVQSGKITVDDIELSAKSKYDKKKLRAKVGMVFQYPEYQLFAETVFDDVAFGLKNFRKDITKEQTEAAVRDAVEMVGLNYEEVKGKSPFDLSGGQKRRAAIAGVIVTRPHILILDEPAAGLDPLGKKEIMELLHKLHREWCSTVIIVSHDMDEIADNCTMAAVISEGRVADCAAPRELFAKAEELDALGLDVPLTAKACAELGKAGIKVDTDFTCEDFAAKVISLFEGGEESAQ